MTGTLTEERFKEQCEALVAFSDKINDGWEMRRDLDDIYIVKKVKLPVVFRDDNNKNPGVPANTISVKEAESDDDSSEDQITLEDSDPCSFSPSSHLVTFEYHVVYSTSYTVPVLYFNAWFSTGKLLTVEEVWKLAPPCSDRYSYITQIEHPILARPFYELHPCRTEQLMGQMGSSEGDTYLVSWISSMGRDVGLSLDVRYAMSGT